MLRMRLILETIPGIAGIADQAARLMEDLPLT